MDVSVKGQFNETVVELAKRFDLMPVTEPEDQAILADNTVHFVGLTYYRPERVQAPLDDINELKDNKYFQFDQLQELIDANSADEESQKILEFWKKEDDRTRLHQEFLADIQEMMPADDFEEDYYTAYPLYRLSGGYLNYEKLSAKGINGLLEEIDQQPGYATNKFLQAAHLSLTYMQELIRLYRDDAKEINPELSEVLDAIIEDKPTTMHQAIQLMWLYITLSEVRNYGRMDEILAPFFQNDESDHRNILEYFKAIQKRNTIFNGRIVIGGKGREEQHADEICKIALQITKENNLTEPQLTLRCHEGMDEAVFDLGMEAIKSGSSYPRLYNDEMNVLNVQRSFKVTEEVAEQYAPFGCGEYVINHKSVGSPNGIINLTKVLEAKLNQGRCMLTDKTITRDHFEQPQTFEELYAALKKELDYQFEILAKQEK